MSSSQESDSYVQQEGPLQLTSAILPNSKEYEAYLGMGLNLWELGIDDSRAVLLHLLNWLVHGEYLLLRCLVGVMGIDTGISLS